MKITRSHLRRLIQEEARMLNEDEQVKQARLDAIESVTKSLTDEVIAIHKKEGRTAPLTHEEKQLIRKRAEQAVAPLPKES